MRPNQYDNWEDEDFELEREFEDLNSMLRDNSSTPPPVPRRLDRRIRKHARFQVGEELKKNWLLAPAVQLALVAIMLFGVGVMFVTSLEQQRIDDEQRRSEPEPNRIENMPRVDAQSETTSTTNQTSLSWIKFRFIVDAAGRVNNIIVIERCLNLSRRVQCGDGDQFDALAIRRLRSQQHSKAGEKEEIVSFIPTDPAL